MSKNKETNNLNVFFDLMRNLRKNEKHIPKEYFAFPGPFIRDVIHFLDDNALSNNNVKAFDVTIDNSLNLRYTGEIGIWLQDIQELKEANVIGYVPSYAHDLVKLLKPGSKFSFKIVEE
jgi:hypothetical protein